MDDQSRQIDELTSRVAALESDKAAADSTFNSQQAQIVEIAQEQDKFAKKYNYHLRTLHGCKTC